ncbi:MAG: MFS transporter [Actinomycetota bacterium]|nr:MFS transporter [Actinomycetota bacterium]
MTKIMFDEKKGMRTFLVVWVGQFVSLVGTNLTGFALSIWVYQETGSATQLSFVLLASQLPQLLFTPIAGALVDRWDRRWAMILSDVGAAIGTFAIVLLLFTDSLQIWHLYFALGFSGIFQSFQWPAYQAATTLLVSKDQYGRAAGLVQMAEAVGQVIAPAVAGALLVFGGLEAVLFIDVVSFLIAVGSLLVLRFPKVETSKVGAAAAGSLLGEARFGWTYIKERKGLLALLAYFSSVNLVFGFVGVLIFPLILGFADEVAMGNVFSLAGIGMIAGSIVMAAWGGPEKRVYGVLGGDIILGIALILFGIRPSLTPIVVGGLIAFFVIPIANGSSTALWQAKVEPDVQGRVFAVRRVLAQIAGPVAMLMAGPLADRVFEPLLQEDGALADSVGNIIGTGPGRGIALMFIILGGLSMVFTLIAYLYPRLRNLEDEIPDYDEIDGEALVPAPAATTA